MLRNRLIPLAVVTFLVSTAAVCSFGPSLEGLLSEEATESEFGDLLETTSNATLDIGTRATGSLNTTDEAHNWTFEGSADQQIVIRVESQDSLDPFVTLYDGSNIELAYNDDAEGLDSRIEYTLPADGTYMLRIGALTPGTYILSIEDETAVAESAELESDLAPADDPEPTAEPTEESEGIPDDSPLGEALDEDGNLDFSFDFDGGFSGGGITQISGISPGTAQSSTFQSAADVHEWELEGTAGQEIVLTLYTQTGVALSAEITDPAAEVLLIEEPVTGLGYTIEQTLPETGLYVIRLRPSAPATYFIVLEDSENTIEFPQNEYFDEFITVDEGSIEVDGSVMGAIDTNDEAYNWTFEGTAGQEIIIRADGEGDLEPDIVLHDAANFPIATSAFEPVLSTTLPEDGLYTIRITTFFNDQEAYTLTLEDITGRDFLDSRETASTDSIEIGGTATGRIETAEEAYNWEFEANLEQNVAITVLGADGSEPLAELYAPGNVLIGTTDDTFVENNTMEIDLPVDGIYIIRVKGTAPVDYDLSVSELGDDFIFESGDVGASSLSFTVPYSPNSPTIITSDIEQHNWTFGGTAGDEALISIIGTDGFEPISMVVKDQAGSAIAEIDDFSGEPVPVAIPADGQYTVSIVATSPGEYELVIE